MPVPDPSWTEVSNDTGISEPGLKDLKAHLIKTKKFNSDSIEFLVSIFPSLIHSIKLSEGLGNYRTIACDTLSIWFVRSTALTSSNPETKSILNEVVTTEACEFLYSYTIDFWNDSGVALGNSLKELFIKLIHFLNVVHGNDEVKSNLFKSWLLESLKLSNNKRVLYFMIENLVQEIKPLDFILQERPTFINDSLNQIGVGALSSYIGKTVFLVLRLLYNNNDDEWLSIWQDDMINSMKNPSLRKPIEIYLLPSLFEVSKPSTIRFIQTISNNDSLFLGTLKIAQDLSMIIEPFDDNNPDHEQIISLQKLETLLISSDVELKLAALSLLTSTPKGSKTIKPYIYPIIFKHLESMFVETDLETRNSLYLIIKSFILRIRDSTYPLNRDALKLMKKDKVRFHDEILVKFGHVKLGKKFLSQIYEFSLLNITPGSSYQRVSFSFKILECLIKSGLDNRIQAIRKFDKHKKIDYAFHLELFNGSLMRLLIDNISNDFEDIRIQSTELLELLPSELSLNEFVDLNVVQERAFGMLGNLKGKSVDSGSKFLQFLIHYHQTKKLAGSHDKIKNVFSELIYRLETLLNKAEDNVLIAAYHYNIHGYFAAFKHIFQVYNFQNTQEEIDLIDKLIELSLKSWNIVKEILQSDSPEGNIPKFIEIDKIKADELEARFGKKAQVLSSYSWRSLKESTNLIDVLLLSKSCPITSKQILTIGPVLLEQLATIRHRGAFSSVYPTFISCCAKCKNSKDENLNHLPIIWLNYNLELIENHRSKLITRRSAGLPYLITGILATHKSLIQYTIDRLLAIAQLMPTEEDLKELDKINLPQVNAFNCIRQILIESSLSKESLNFIDLALNLSLQSFSSEIWSVKNCSVMLFTSIQNRLFNKKKTTQASAVAGSVGVVGHGGVNLASVSSSGSIGGGGMSARLFFSRFKGLKDILITNLKKCIQVDDNEMIFPILTILSKLESTPSSNGEFIMDEFKELIMDCLKNKNWKIREMASRSLPSLVSLDDTFIECLKLLTLIDSCKDNNQMHGLVLGIKELLIRYSLKNNVFDVDQLLVDAVMKKLVDVVKLNCFEINLSYFQLVNLFFGKCLTFNEINLLGNWFIENNEIGVSGSLNGSKQLSLKETTVILLNFYLYHRLDELYDLIELAIISEFYEVQLSTIEFIIENLSELSNEFKQALLDDLWKIIEKPIWNNLRSAYLRLINYLIRYGDNQEQEQQWKLQEYDKNQEDITNKIRLIFNNLSTINESLKLNSLEILGSLIAHHYNYSQGSLEYFDTWMNKLIQLSNDTEYLIRLSCLNSLVSFNHVYKFYKTPNYMKFKVLIHLFNFLSDDDDEIRQYASNELRETADLMKTEEVMPIAVEKQMINYFIKTLPTLNDNELINRLLIEDLKVFEIMDWETTYNTESTTTLLFSIERNNFYKDLISQNCLKIKLIDSQLKSNPQLTQRYQESLNAQIASLITLVKTNGFKEDGCLGWLSDLNNFQLCYNVLSRANSSHDDDDDDVDELIQLIILNKHCHPLIKLIT